MENIEGANKRSDFLSDFRFEERARAVLIRAVRSGVWLILFGIGYYWTARLSLGVLFQRSQIGLVWVPNALFLSALVLTSRRSWWMILAVVSVAHVLALAPSTPVWRLVWQIPVNAGFVIATTEVLRRFIGFPLRFESRREVLIYMGLAVVMPVSLALTGPGFVRSLAGLETVFSPPIAFARLVMANLTPLLLVTPAVLLCALGAKRWRAISKGAVVEAATIMGTVIVVGVIAVTAGPQLARFPWLLVLTFPPLIWAAVRLGPLGASMSLLCIAALSIAGASRQLGPFVLSASNDVVLSLQLYWIAIALPVMLLAAVIRERTLVASALEDQRNQLSHVTRIATAGELSVALAHELRQPLTAILANAQAARLMLARQPTDLPMLRATLSDIESENRHAANVITHLRLFLRNGESRFETLDVEKVVRDALALSRSALALADVELHVHFADRLPPVRGDAVKLLQVIVNLIVNGCDAMNGTPASSRHLRVELSRPDAQHVEVLVADSGVGLPNASAERVFEPFYTTKPEGLGLGLTIARTIATSHGGTLWGENNGRGGATFHLVLPVS
jgi:signal transduction histidine kinase